MYVSVSPMAGAKVLRAGLKRSGSAVIRLLTAVDCSVLFIRPGVSRAADLCQAGTPGFMTPPQAEIKSGEEFSFLCLVRGDTNHGDKREMVTLTVCRIELLNDEVYDPSLPQGKLHRC